MVSILGIIFDFKLNSASKLLMLKTSFTSSQNDKIINYTPQKKTILFHQ